MPQLSPTLRSFYFSAFADRERDFGRLTLTAEARVGGPFAAKPASLSGIRPHQATAPCGVSRCAATHLGGCSLATRLALYGVRCDCAGLSAGRASPWLVLPWRCRRGGVSVASARPIRLSPLSAGSARPSNGGGDGRPSPGRATARWESAGKSENGRRCAASSLTSAIPSPPANQQPDSPPPAATRTRVQTPLPPTWSL